MTRPDDEEDTRANGNGRAFGTLKAWLPLIGLAMTLGVGWADLKAGAAQRQAQIAALQEALHGLAEEIHELRRDFVTHMTDTRSPRARDASGGAPQ